MVNGLSTRVFIENGPAEQQLRVQAQRSSGRIWRALDAESRLAAVERALTPAKDLIDAIALAL
jgi:hypothetical protein